MAFKARLPNESDVTPTDNDLIIGDIHADLDGAKGALSKAGYNPDKQRLFTVGDNIDRGPQAKETMDFMHKYGVQSIMGNHDFAHHRYGQHMMNAAATGKAIPMKLTPEMEDAKNQLGDDYLKHTKTMGNYPLYLPFQDAQGKGYLVHGGVSPHHSIEDQQPDRMLIRRHHPMPQGFMHGESDEFRFWQRSYPGHLGTILHGHSPSETHDFHGNKNVYSLDGGGVMGSLTPWGGKHRVVRLGDRQVFESPGSPQAEAHYRSIWGDKLKNLYT